MRGPGFVMSCFSRASPLAVRPLVAHIRSEAIDMNMAVPPSNAKTMSAPLHVQRKNPPDSPGSHQLQAHRDDEQYTPDLFSNEYLHYRWSYREEH